MMKKFFYLCLTLAVVALSACSDDDQSSFNFSDVKGKAVIKGTVTYQPGYVKNDGGGVKQNVAANGAVVTVEVSNSEYADNALGSKVYQITTDENGQYSIEIPAGVKNVVASVSVKDFEGTYSQYVNNSLLTVSGVKYSTSSAKNVALSDGRTESVDLSLTSVKQPEIASRDIKTTVKGCVQTMVEKIYDTNSNYSYLTTGLKSLQNAKVVLTFTNSSDNGRELRYETTTSTTGDFSVNAALFDNWQMDNTHVNLEILGFTGTITHYYLDYKDTKYNWRSQEVNVYFDPTAAGYASLSEKNLSIAYDFGKVTQYFTVINRDVIKGIGNSIDYDNNGNQLYERNNPLGL